MSSRAARLLRSAALLASGAALSAAAGCRQAAPGAGVEASPRKAAPRAAAAAPLTFSDITGAAGIHFRHNNGAFGKKYYPETMGSGCAFFDYDRDGWIDLLFVNGCDFPDAPRGNPRRARLSSGEAAGRRSTLRLYRNRGAEGAPGTFVDVTRSAGLDVELYGIGCAVGDYDNDDDLDLYVTTAFGGNRLYENQGESSRGPRFADVTRSAGVGNGGRFAASALWFDYDRDGRLDLFVCNYIRWSPATNIRCEVRPGIREYCTPETYDGVPCRLYRNVGGPGGPPGFRDVSSETGLDRFVGKSMTPALCDTNGDGWLDLVVTNDTQPTFLLLNEAGPGGQRVFREVGMEAGVALGESGKAKAGMGVDAADVGNDGRTAILTSNFTGESLSYFVSQPSGTFIDSTALAGFGHTSLLYLGWGLFFLDCDLDGWKDAFVTNGHIYPNVRSYQPTIRYAQRPLLYRNQGDGTFREVGASAGSGLAPIVGRGAAFGDIDHDGDLDIAINTSGAAARLIRNDGGSANHWLCLALEGSRSNRDAIGTVVRVRAGGLTQTQMVRGGGSYASQSDLRLTFGLGAASSVERLEVRWADGQTETASGLAANQRLGLREGSVAHPESLP